MSNTLYVGHQNNVLFSVLAQFFGKEAMNMRLFLFETHEFVTTPDKMLNVLIRTASDRSVGMVLFGNYYMMDYELMGSDGRKAIIAAISTAWKRSSKAFIIMSSTYATGPGYWIW